MNHLTMQFATATSFIFNFIIMKKLSRDEMKKVMGGMNAPGGACAEDHTWLVCSTPNGTES